MLALSRSYQGAAVLAAAAELDVFSVLGEREGVTAEELAGRLGLDARGTSILLDALVALGLTDKRGARYSVSPEVSALLTGEGGRTVLAMVQHQANCLRRWSQLAMTVKTGVPAPRIASVLGERGDLEAFIGAMHNVSAPVADEVVSALEPMGFHHLLDVGGASGTWTMAFLRRCPAGRATLFDLPSVIPLAKARLIEAGMQDRVDLVAGDYAKDELPGGADLAWVSAIVHQNSREENRALFGKVYRALVPGGRIAIRDILMSEERTAPVAGALFAVNMLVSTGGGGTYTVEELKQDLGAAGFSGVQVVRKDEGMNAVLTGTQERLKA